MIKLAAFGIFYFLYMRCPWLNYHLLVMQATLHLQIIEVILINVYTHISCFSALCSVQVLYHDDYALNLTSNLCKRGEVLTQRSKKIFGS